MITKLKSGRFAVYDNDYDEFVGTFDTEKEATNWDESSFTIKIKETEREALLEKINTSPQTEDVWVVFEECDDPHYPPHIVRIFTHLGLAKQFIATGNPEDPALFTRKIPVFTGNKV